MGLWIVIGITLLLIAFAATWFVLRRRRSNDDDDGKVIRSIVLLQAQPRKPSDDEIAAAVRNAWGAKLARGPQSGDGDFMIHLPSAGPPSCVAVRVSGVMYVINSMDSPYINKATQSEDGTRILQQHTACTSISFHGDLPADWTVARLYARLGRIVVALADDNTLGFCLTEFNRVYPNTGETRAALLSPDPLATLLQ